MKKILLFVIGILAVVCIIMGFSKTKSINEQKIIYSNELSTVKEIRIESNSKINVRASNTKDLNATLSGDVKYISKNKLSEALLVSNIEDGILYINYNLAEDEESKAIFGINLNKVSLVIDIPNSLKDKLYIKSQYSSVNVENVNFRSIECVSDIGDIDITLLKISNSINVKTNSGAIKLNLPNNEKFNLSTVTTVENIKNDLIRNVDNSLNINKINLATEIGQIEIYGND